MNNEKFLSHNELAENQNIYFSILLNDQQSKAVEGMPEIFPGFS